MVITVTSHYVNTSGWKKREYGVQYTENYWQADDKAWWTESSGEAWSAMISSRWYTMVGVGTSHSAADGHPFCNDADEDKHRHGKHHVEDVLIPGRRLAILVLPGSTTGKPRVSATSFVEDIDTSFSTMIMHVLSCMGHGLRASAGSVPGNVGRGPLEKVANAVPHLAQLVAHKLQPLCKLLNWALDVSLLLGAQHTVSQCME